MVSPLMQLAIFWLVFGFILKNGYPNFVILLFAGLIVWNFFSGALNTSTGIIVERAGIVKKVAFPREILPLSTVGAQIFYFSMQAVAMAVILVVLQSSPDWGLFWLLIPAMAALLVLASAFSVLLSALNVKLRDMRHLIEVTMQLWFWLTPIVYPYEKLAPHLHSAHIAWLYLANPVTPIVLTFQRVFYPHLTVVSTNTPKGHPPVILPVLPTWSPATYAGLDCLILAGATALLVFAVWVFGRLEGNFAEEL
jgi:ABC-2 type transport system permease protein